MTEWSNDECWLWTGSKSRNGYGAISIGGRTFRVHRVIYELTYGPIPKGMFVCHHCDNKSCCNPRHLFIGTNLDNVADMMTKHPKHANAKLTAADIQKIRFDERPQRIVAADYGVTGMTISRIRRRVNWKHI